MPPVDPTETATPIAIEVLTASTVDGDGVFDTLMRAARSHLELEFKANRIKTGEYATVYLGTMEAAMRTALEFTLQKQKNTLENAVLIAQECKLRAEYDLTIQSTLKVIEEKNLVLQKIATERAQTVAAAVDEGSVIGRQRTLYKAQSDGFARDAEQKAAKLLVDTWNVRRTTDEATVADGINKLNDATIGRAIDKLLLGVNA